MDSWTWLTVDDDLQISPCWPILANVGHVIIFASQIVSALDLGHILASAQVTLWLITSDRVVWRPKRRLGQTGDQITRHQCPDSSWDPFIHYHSFIFIRYQPVPVVCWVCLCAHFVPDSSQNHRRRRSITGKGLNEACASLWAQAHDLQHYYGSAEALAAARVPRWLVAVLRLHEGSWRGQLQLNSHSWNPMIIFISCLYDDTCSRFVIRISTASHSQTIEKLKLCSVKFQGLVKEKPRPLAVGVAI